MVLVPWNSNWVSEFAAERDRIHEIVAGDGLILHHIGSTAVSGLVAKPIIDILGEWAGPIGDFDQFRMEFEKAGYIWRGEYGIPGRRFLFRTDPKQEYSYCHVHVFAAGDPEIERHLRFRDYLRSNEGARNEYAKLKEALSEQFRDSRDDYTAGKASFIAEILSTKCHAARSKHT